VVAPPSIPIQNLYYLLCYAWNRFPEGRVIDISGIKGPDLPNLLAKVLIGGTQHLLRRGVDRGYLAFDEETGRLRGRLMFGETIRRALLLQARASCQYDDISHDVLHNQILKSTINLLAKASELDPALRHCLRILDRDLNDISLIRLSTAVFRRVQLYSNNAFYAFLMKVCALVHEAMIPEERSGTFRFRDILRDEAKMAAIFQNFVLNFYRLEQSEYQVKSEAISWQAIPLSNAAADLLPAMRTDVSLRSPTRTIIIDTKFYKDALQTYFDRRSIRSAHLYQIFAYVKNLEHRIGVDADAEGILLYPTVDQELHLRYEMQGHIISVCTLDLMQDWRRVHSQLLGIVDLASYPR
jgi:5-methylcytosine-specific restriction enzyme subunit McrC